MLVLALSSAQAGPKPEGADSLDLAGWLALARERSPALVGAAAGVREAEGRYAVARSGRGPKVQGGALYLRFQDPPTLGLGPLGGYAPIPLNGYYVQMQVVQPLYTGGRVSAAVKAAEWGTRAAESSALSAEVELSAAVAHAYDDLLLARAVGGVARQSAETLREALRVAREHYAAGTVARLDVLRAQTRLSSAEAAVRAAEVAEATARERLAALVGLDPDSAPPVAGSLEYVEFDVDLAVLEDLARSARPDVGALRALARSYEAGAAISRAARRPTLSLYAMTLLTRPELVTGEERWAWELLGGLQLSWSLFDSGAAGGEAAAARAAAERAEAEARRLEAAAVARVRAQAYELRRAAEDVRRGRENVALAERALEIAQERYLEGVGIQLEVLEAEADLRTTRADLLRAIHAYRSAAIELRRAVGLPADAPLPGIESEGDS